MAFIGNVPAESYITTVKDTFSGNGSTTAFTLSQPTLTNDVRVVVENVVQEPTTAYSVAGTTLTFTSAPPSGSNNVYVIHLGPAVQTTVPPETFGVGSIYGASDTDTAITFEGSGVTTFDQNGSEAGRFDASGNFLVGKTAVGDNTAGFDARSSGRTAIVASGTAPLTLNRQTSDGSAIDLLKDGATVGLIGAKNSDLTIGTSDTGIRFLDGSDSVMPVNPTTGADSDATLNLGVSSARWKDLYLSGGVYLGGTTSMNYLDDYEEGTWTATSRFGTVTGNDPKNSYIKVGQKVTVWGQVSNFSDTSTNDGIQIGGLPFTVNATFNSFVAGSCLVSGSSSDDPQACYIQSDSRFAFYQGGTGANILKHTEISGGGINIWFIVTYYTSS